MYLDDQERPVCCDCELPGTFCSGVPGVLAFMEDGRLAPGAYVERCDMCCRFDSDEAARDALVERGLAAPQPADCLSFTVHCLAVVRVKYTGIVARTPKEAAHCVRARFSWDAHRGKAEFTDDFTGFVVDLDGVPTYRWSQEFDGDLEEVKRRSPKGD